MRKALFALPSFFRSDLHIAGVLATDLFSFNASLGATIEAQVVEGLNTLRTTWDPDQRYPTYAFIRQSQRFPDVILRSLEPQADPPILLGIELKGWYGLAKESEPSFRYRVTPAVCAPRDLRVVYPWALSAVVSGSPQLYAPFVIGARYAAEYRNWHWQYGRQTEGSTAITLSSVTQPYPVKSDAIADRAVDDRGGNFGRFARTGLMDAYMAHLFREELSAIPLDAWRQFLAIFSENRREADALRALDRLTQHYAAEATTPTIERFLESLHALLGDER